MRTARCRMWILTERFCDEICSLSLPLVCLFTYTNTSTHTHTHTCTYTHTHTHTFTHTHTHTHTHTQLSHSLTYRYEPASFQHCQIPQSSPCLPAMLRSHVQIYVCMCVCVRTFIYNYDKCIISYVHSVYVCAILLEFRCFPFLLYLF